MHCFIFLLCLFGISIAILPIVIVIVIHGHCFVDGEPVLDLVYPLVQHIGDGFAWLQDQQHTRFQHITTAISNTTILYIISNHHRHTSIAIC